MAVDKAANIFSKASHYWRQPGWQLTFVLAILLLTFLRLGLPATLEWHLSPGERIDQLAGFYPPEQEPDGRRYRWMSNHGRLTFPGSGSASLLLSIASPHWQPTTPVTISLGKQAVSFALPAGTHRVHLFVPPTHLASRTLHLAAQASQPAGGQRMLGLKVYSIALHTSDGWTALNAALLLGIMITVSLVAYRRRQAWWCLSLVCLFMLPLSLLASLMPWIALVTSSWIMVVRARLTRHSALVIGALIFLVYLAASPFSLTTTNDGSHYALIRAMGDEGRLAIDSFTPYAGRRDIAWRAGHYYSDRPPGTALLSLPLYLATRLISANDTSYPGLEAILVQNALIGALAVSILYQVCRKLGITQSGALFTALAYGLATIHWKYSTILYSHALSATLSLLALWLALCTERRWQALLLGLVASFSIAVEYTTVLLIPPLLLLALWRRWRLTGWVAAGLALGILPLVSYNLAAFGHPLHTGYTYHATFDWARQPEETFVHPLPSGLWDLLFDTGTTIQGIIPLSPVYLLVVPGAVLLWSTDRRLAALWLLLLLPTLLLIATHRTFFGGSDRDPRYLAAILPFLAWPLAWVWERIRRWNRPVRLAGQAVCGSLLLVSILNQLKHLAYTNGHTIVKIAGPHTIWNWRFTWYEFWWAALPGQTSIWDVLAVMIVLLSLLLAIQRIRSLRRPGHAYLRSNKVLDSK